MGAGAKPQVRRPVGAASLRNPSQPKPPPAEAITGIRDRGVKLPVVAFSREATREVADKSGGVFIEPFPDEAQERRANRRWAKRRSG